MAQIIWSDVSDTASELSVTPPVARIVILSLVNGRNLAVDNFDGEDGEQTRAARILLAAHFATMLARRGLSAVASQSEGGVAQSYWNAWMNPRALQLTGYGQMLMGMIAGTAARAGALV